jgi:osmotically-inducible protein OsmY
MFRQIKVLPPRVILTNDEALLQSVQAALSRLKPLQAARLPIRVQVSDGLVTLGGAIGSFAVKSQTLRAVRGVPGVKRVHDALFTDSELQALVSAALSASPSTNPVCAAIVVHVCDGTVVLAGRVPDAMLAQTAQEIAASQPGVRAVSNRLQVRLTTSHCPIANLTSATVTRHNQVSSRNPATPS